MNKLPNVNIGLSNGNLGRPSESEDGIAAIIGSGIAVTDKFALGDIIGPFFSPLDAEAKGIDAAYDTANKSLIYQHIVDFYAEAGVGSELYVMVVADTVTMTEMADKTKDNIAKLLRTLDGKIRLVAITRVPDANYTPTVLSGFDDDVFTAVEKAQELAEYEFTKQRPVDIFIEGRDFQGTASAAKDIRDAATGTNANAVSVVISCDPDVSAIDEKYNAYANVGLALGRAAASSVQENIGKVKNGKLNISKAGLSNGAEITEFNQDVDFDVLNDFGYIFIRTFPGKAGLYFNDDHNACPITDDYAYKNRKRVINKAARIAYRVFVDEINSDSEVDESTGKLTPATIKAFQNMIEESIELDMSGEISGVSAFVDPDQNVLSLDLIEIELNITPKTTNRNFDITLGFSNPLA